MKTITLQTIGSFKTADLVRSVIERPANGVNLTAMRASIRVLDALDKLEPDAVELQLEDQDHATLVNALNATTFTVVNRELLAAVDEVLNAK